MPAISDRNLTVYLGQDDRIHRMVPNHRPAGILPILFILSKTPAFQPVPSVPHQSKTVPIKGTIMGRPEVAEGGLPLPETD